MLLKALDLLRTLGWALMYFIYNLIDNLFDILKGLNSFDIINSVSGNENFSNFQKSIVAIAVTLLGLFAITRFVKKIVDPDENQTTEVIVKEIVKCGMLIIFSTFLFVQASIFSVQLAGFTSNIFDKQKVSLSDSMLNMYVKHSAGYKDSDDFKDEDIEKNIKNGNFNGKKMYNDKYVTSKRAILPDVKDYKYSVNFIMGTIVGGFFLYSLFFCGMMLARKQIEFLFLFIISPIVFATSVGNKDRRSAVTQSLISLILQGAVIMLIISLTAIIMREINDTVFFDDTIKDVIIKSIMYLGCGTFLLTGSQVVNKFIGGNVSANAGREQMMAMMGAGQTMGAMASAGGGALGGAIMAGAGAGAIGVANAGKVGNSIMGKVGGGIASFGGKLQGGALGGIGANLSHIGSYMQGSSMLNAEKIANNKGKGGLAKFGSDMFKRGTGSMGSAINTVSPFKTNSYKKWR